MGITGWTDPDGDGIESPITSGGGAGAVSSVAGRTGDVVLAVADVSGAAPSASPTFTGTVTLPSGIVVPSSAVATTQSPGDNSTKIATTAYADAAAAARAPASGIAESAITNLVSDLAAKAALASPALTGSPTAPTQNANDNSTKLASTAYVDRMRPAAGYYNGSFNCAETIPRVPVESFAATVSIGTTGQMVSYPVLLYAGMVITSISFRSGTTAGVTMTHWWAALYDTQATPALIAQSADQTSAAIAASTNFTLALGSPAPYTVPTTGIYYVALSVTASTVPTLTGIAGGTAINGGIISGQKVLAQTSGSALGATAPGTIATPTTVAGVGYMVTS